MPSSSSGSHAAMIEKAKTALYLRCSENPDHLYNQVELSALGVVPTKDANDLMQCIQILTNEGRFKLLQTDTSIVWKVVREEDAAKYKNLSADEALVYNHIESAGREGIWTRTLKARTNLHQTVQLRCLKSLEGRNMIKSMVNVKYPTRKYFILSTLQPADDTTGGPWFTDGELDVEFIEQMSAQIEKYIFSKSFVRVRPTASKKDKMSKTQAEEMRNKDLQEKKAPLNVRDTLLPMPPGHMDYPTASEISKWVRGSGLTPVPLEESQIRQLLDILYYDGRIEKVMGGIGFKAVRRPIGDDEEGVGNGLTEAPCGRCPVFNLCEEGGPVSASNCEYFKTWLDV
ncbi:DNA-directed RNA polymerase III subunit Rpc34 [Xylona heveae TC161]|uniref:DNA-directed RNA polymerase III subunit RPC6 n=1 Tax=Xylona heveae (strain CBS 132557 / TC161) TaxID=1328760 RepID=A0A165GPK5_XYLHT|nr:DNA-directed RNA polymerase III subunit Rpc34 [Xylona heveae TC161]KZF22438.1 DNA-directed RNA polymerase III subunit Rpc34 [Xylona heveae TC161]